MKRILFFFAIAILAMVSIKASAQATTTVFEDNYAEFCKKNNVKDKTALTHTESNIRLGSVKLWALSYENAVNSNVYVSNRQGWIFRNAISRGTFYLGLSNQYKGYMAIADCKKGDKVLLALTKVPDTPINASLDETTSSWSYVFDDNKHKADYTVYTLTVEEDGVAGAEIPAGTYIGKISVTRTLSSTTLTAGGNGYTAFSSANNFTVAGADAYYVKTANSASVALEQIASGSVIPANQGVILKAEAKGDDVTITYTSDEAATLDGNLLKPVLSATTAFEATGTNYVLATSQDSETAFYLTKGDDATWAKLVNKCYLNIPSNNAAKKLSIGFGETTGIERMQVVDDNADSDHAAYNLAGQRVSPAAKGIVIINGKKYIDR